MTVRFVSESLQPLVATADPAAMADGGPGLPKEFRWRGRTLEVAGLLRSWRETGRCRHGSGEMYVRKHWFEVVTSERETLKIYFERQPRGRRRGEPRWWLYTIGPQDSAHRRQP